MSNSSKLVNGFKWALLEQSSVQIISFLVFLLLAKLLGPKTFGLMALAQMFIMLIANVIQQGFAQAIVQREHIEEQHVNCAFWLNIGQSIIALALTLFFAPTIATFFGEPELTDLIRALTLIFLITPLWTIQQALFKRELNFKPLAKQMLVATLFGNFVAVVMALTDFGIWSLIAREICTKAVSSVLLMRASSWRPALDMTRRHASEILGFAVHMVSGNLIAFANLQLPGFLIGYFLGATELGYFHVAMRLVNIINDLITRTIEKVAMPAFARLQEHKEQLLATFNAITQASVVIVVPIFLGMALVVNELVPLIFGDKWLPSIPSMRVLLLIGIAQSITYILIALLIGTGHPAVRSRLLLAEALTKTACIMVVVNQGITAVSTAIVIAAFIMLPLWLLTAKRILAFSFGPYLKAIAPGVVSAAVMSVAILFTRQQLDSSLPPELLLAALVVVGISSYGLTMLVLFRATIINALNMLRNNR